MPKLVNPALPDMETLGADYVPLDTRGVDPRYDYIRNDPRIRTALPAFSNEAMKKRPYNATKAIESTLPYISVKRAQQKIKTGIAPVDVLLQNHGHANPLTKTAVINELYTIPEEILHLTDLIYGNKLYGKRFTDREDFRDASTKGTLRMAEAYTSHKQNKNGDLVPVYKKPDVYPSVRNGDRMRQLLREHPDSPFYGDNEELLGSHGTLYEIGNQVTDFPRFDRRAAAMKESLPAIVELHPDTAQKYYPEALKLIDEFFDAIPYEE